ncbi:hypothetical protein [Emticicia sp. C21]|uniref:hypothetical protein n=1 Tax=Emticicia sp. C21 TaxID=2302915 RepID=UPI000E3463C4|nr:hypothetical protein [Emticicia sp. C21]RFS16160.1 hypothetical protein D0T08_10735 [Emticicia sp. C21]
MKNNFLKIASLCIALGVAVTACTKDADNNSVTPDAQSAAVVADNQTIQDGSEDVYELVDDVTFLPFGGRNFRETGGGDKGKHGGHFPSLGIGWDKPWRGRFDNCADVSKTVANNTITIVYDYTSVADGVCDDKAVGGKMTISIPVKPDSGFSGTLTRTVTYENLKRDTLVVNGTHTITTTVANGKATVSEKLANITITNTNTNKIITYTSTKKRAVDNKGTATKDDDESQTTGTTNAKSSDGTEFTANITKTLIVKRSCKDSRGFPVSGTIEIKPFSGDTKIVDYGDGTCDLKYTVTVNGVTEEKEKTKPTKREKG